VNGENVSEKMVGHAGGPKEGEYIARPITLRGQETTNQFTGIQLGKGEKEIGMSRMQRVKITLSESPKTPTPKGNP